MKIFGLPIFGFFLPYIGRIKLHLNGDGSVVDTGKADVLDEVGPYYVTPLTFEWFGFGMPITKSMVYSTKTNEAVDPPWVYA